MIRYDLIVLLLLAFTSLYLRFHDISNPPCIVFDEIHFGGFVSSYFKGEHFFDIHPPLAKLIMFSGAKIFGFDSKFNFSEIGKAYDSDFYVNQRRISAFFSSLVPIILYFTMKLRGYSVGSSFICGFIMCFDTMSIQQGRLILTDVILYFFVSSSILVLNMSIKNPSYKNLIILGLLLGSSVSCKFTSGSIVLYSLYMHFKNVMSYRKFINRCLVIGLSSILVFLLSFHIHFSILKNPGEGDAFYPKNFRSYNSFSKCIISVYLMIKYGNSISESHPYSSKWYQWPLLLSGPILIHRDKSYYLTLFYNPVTAIASLVGVVVSTIYKNYHILIGYCLSLIPFGFLSRVTFLYHYEIAFIFGIIGLSESSEMIKIDRWFVLSLLSVSIIIVHFALSEIDTFRNR